MHEDLDGYLEHARREMFPKMRASAFSLVIAGEPDPKLRLEIGAAANLWMVIRTPLGPLGVTAIAMNVFATALCGLSARDLLRLKGARR